MRSTEPSSGSLGGRCARVPIASTCEASLAADLRGVAGAGLDPEFQEARPARLLIDEDVVCGHCGSKAVVRDNARSGARSGERPLRAFYVRFKAALGESHGLVELEIRGPKIFF